MFILFDLMPLTMAGTLLREDNDLIQSQVDGMALSHVLVLLKCMLHLQAADDLPINERLHPNYFVLHPEVGILECCWNLWQTLFWFWLFDLV